MASIDLRLGSYYLLDGDFGAFDGFAAEEADAAFGEFNYAVFGGVNGEVA